MGVTPNFDFPFPDNDTLISASAPIFESFAYLVDTVLAQANAADTYTVPGTLVQTFTTSGTFTPPTGVSVFSVVLIGGGGSGYRGDGGTSSTANWAAGGGAGGEIRVYRDVTIGGPLSVTVGGANTGTALGPTMAARSVGAAATTSAGAPFAIYPSSFGGGAFGGVGQAGPLVNGTRYAGGGGGGGGWSNYGPGGAGGAGGGGTGGGGSPNPSGGTNGTGGGGGGTQYYYATPGPGGSGRVMIYTEQTFSGTAPDPITPTIYAALDAAGVVIGVYALDGADPKLPGVTFDALQVYPSDPQPTGETFKDENGNDVPVLAWPEAGWTFDTVNGWAPPT